MRWCCFVFLLIGGRLAYIQLVDSRYERTGATPTRCAMWCSTRRAAKSSTATGSIWSQSRECYDLMVIYSEIDKKGFDTLRMCEVLGLSREKLETRACAMPGCAPVRPAW